jgi:hypothetical protein
MDSSNEKIPLLNKTNRILMKGSGDGHSEFTISLMTNIKPLQPKEKKLWMSVQLHSATPVKQPQLYYFSETIALL